jgi:DNA-binding transcriptional LysR family regulator
MVNLKGRDPMELRQLQYAVQIAQERNFSRAAEKLHIAQPSLSQQLSKMEKELGVLLFHRNTNAVEPTHAGERFVEKARRILDLVEQLRIEMEDISQMRKGKLVVGSLPITGSHILPLVLPEFQHRYPEIEIVLTEETTSRLEQLTAHGQTDLSVLSLPLSEPSLHGEVLLEEEIFLAVPPAHALSRELGEHGEEVPLERFKDEPFIVLKRGQGFRQISLDLCRQAGFTPNIVFESSNIETAQSLVAAGMGVAFIPEMVARSPRSRFVPHYLRLAGRPKRTLVVAYKKGRYLSKAAEAFLAVALEVVRQARQDHQL